jgi:hypothetical protein
METGDGVVEVDGNGVLSENSKKATYAVKVGLAQMFRGGLIMDEVGLFLLGFKRQLKALRKTKQCFTLERARKSIFLPYY